jgi:maltose-binding protein MalE
MMKKMICFAAITVLLIIGAAISQEQESQAKKPTADRHKDRGITCSVCHDGENEPKAAASPKSCLTCKNHDSLQTAAERTNAAKGFKFNPHHNHILETNKLECTQCHQSHKADTVVCYDCHQLMKFK